MEEGSIDIEKVNKIKNRNQGTGFGFLFFMLKFAEK